jgi:tol-pal system protein YbgF
LKKHVTTTLLAVALCAGAVQPTYAVSKETLQMMQQLDQLQQAVQNLQKTVDTQTAVLKTLVEQTSDNVNSMKANLAELRKAMEGNLATSNARMDSMTSEVQALSASLDEAKARLAKLSDQIAQTQNMIQTLNTPPPASTTQATPGSPTQPGDAKPKVPDPDSLYKSGLSYYNGGQYQLAMQSFQDYLHYYGDTDLASNAQFYIGDCYYNLGNYTQAITEYDKCMERYPGGNKQAAAQLKKGYALQQLGQAHAAARELRSLIQRFPNSDEAELARQRLKKLGVASSRTGSRAQR